MIDTHVHLCSTARYAELEAYCDALGIIRCALVSLPDLQIGTYNAAILHALRTRPDRYVGFGCLDYRGWRRGTFDPSAQVRTLKEQGFFGLKLWIGKPLVEQQIGMDLLSRPIADAVETAGELGMPVLVHVADPPEFWGSGGLYGSQVPTFREYIDAFGSFLALHPAVQVICAHMMFLAGGLQELSGMLREYPELLLDTAPGRWCYRILSQQREEAREFFMREHRRILFGTDSMFFSETDQLFPYRQLSDNLQTARQLISFLETDSQITDPYPWKDSPVQQQLACLNLPAELCREIEEINPARLLQQGTW
jgi:predicted TIM-barrel fold metal-dependent hydrolase